MCKRRIIRDDSAPPTHLFCLQPTRVTRMASLSPESKLQSFRRAVAAHAKAGPLAAFPRGASEAATHPHGEKDDAQLVEDRRRGLVFDARGLSDAILRAVQLKAQLRAESPEAIRTAPVVATHALPEPVSPKAYKFQPGTSAGLVAGDRCNTAQRRMASAPDYTGFAKYRGQPTPHFSGQGDFCRTPSASSRIMLAITNGANLTIPGRAADFRAEVRGLMCDTCCARASRSALISASMHQD
jgi:hypothetical protein